VRNKPKNNGKSSAMQEQQQQVRSPLPRSLPRRGRKPPFFGGLATAITGLELHHGLMPPDYPFQASSGTISAADHAFCWIRIHAAIHCPWLPRRTPNSL